MVGTTFGFKSASVLCSSALTRLQKWSLVFFILILSQSHYPVACRSMNCLRPECSIIVMYKKLVWTYLCFGTFFIIPAEVTIRRWVDSDHKGIVVVGVNTQVGCTSKTMPVLRDPKESKKKEIIIAPFWQAWIIDARQDGAISSRRLNSDPMLYSIL